MVTLEDVHGAGREPLSGPLGRHLMAHRPQVLEITRRHGARNVRVFGSVARSEETKASDIDLLVEVESGRTLLDLSALIAELSSVLNVEVDVATPALLRSEIREKVLAQAIRL
jgi:predicted nucleotidyltransferase